MKKLTLVFMMLVVAMLLVACNTATTDIQSDSKSESESESGETDQTVEEDIFDGKPYVLTFVSNGDGTCVVSEILVNPEHREKIVLDIPERSPEGDKVTAVTFEQFDSNVPRKIAKEDFEDILTDIEEYLEYDENLTESQKLLIPKKMEAFYALRDPNDESLSNSSKQYILEQYPESAITPIYVFVPDAKPKEINEWSRIFFEYARYTAHDRNTDDDDLLRKLGKEPSGKKVNGGEYITEIRLPANISVPISLYDSCFGLESVTFSEGVTELPDLSRCYSIPKVYIPGSVESIDVSLLCDGTEDYTFGGTIAEWNNRITGYGYASTDTVLHCTDGDAALDTRTMKATKK